MDQPTQELHLCTPVTLVTTLCEPAVRQAREMASSAGPSRLSRNVVRRCSRFGLRVRLVISDAAPFYVSLSPRPPRLGVFVPSFDGVRWEQSFEAVLASQSRLWGGSGSLLFPAEDDLADNELFWMLAELLDADYLATASFTRRDVFELVPAACKSWEEQERAAMDRDIPEAPEDERDRLIEQGLSEGVGAWHPAPDLMALIGRRLAPFHGRETRRLPEIPVNDRRALTERVRHQFPDVTQLLGWPDEISNPSADLGAVERLVITDMFGRLPTGFVEALEAAGKARVTPWNVRPGHSAFAARTIRNMTVPWTLSQLGLNWWLQGIESKSVILVVGGSAWDFTLFMALRRWRTTAYWLPSELTADQAFLHSLNTALFTELHDATDQHALVTSWSDEALSGQVANDLNTSPLVRVPSRAVDWRETLPRRTFQLAERDGPRRETPVPLHQGATVHLATPVPAQADAENSGYFHWLTEILAQGWAPLRHGAIGPAVLDEPAADSGRTRAGRGVSVYVSTGLFTYSGTSLEVQTVQPQLKPLSLVEQLNAAMEPEGWSCEASDKGAYAAESAVLFGGFRPLAKALLDPHTRATIEAFRATDASAGEDEPPGKSTSDGRRYLTLADLAVVLGDEAAAEQVCADLAERGVLNRGLLLKCMKCRRASWYALAEVTDNFTCRRCRSEQRTAAPAWLGTVEPVWHYELAEVVRALLDHDGELPILTVDKLFPEPRRLQDDIEVAFEITVFSPDQRGSETDIVVRDRSALWLGEATKKNCLKDAGAAETRRLERLAALSKALAARHVVLASTGKFRNSTTGRANAHFQGFWPKLHIEEGVETDASQLNQSTAAE
jgi:hypothetical protein